jgi:hypothetical protein
MEDAVVDNSIVASIIIRRVGKRYIRITRVRSSPF